MQIAEQIEIDDLVIIIMDIMALKEEVSSIEEIITKEDILTILLTRQIYSKLHIR